ncbi:MAG: four helix bundle protein [Prevotellaceae bacterium]|jgi:four helix bundle protein|nr:four helix bundle protein [Prevotellaceae bacterium]
MVITKFEDIIAWQKAQELAVVVYAAFDDCKDFSFKNQICRAAVSVSNNIAEGFDRSSDADFVKFLYIAKASCSEVRSMLYLAEKLKFTDCSAAIMELSKEVSRLMTGLIKSIKI